MQFESTITDETSVSRLTARPTFPRWHGRAWLLGAALLLGLPAQAFLGRLEFVADDHFAGATLRRGIQATEEQCHTAGAAAVWAPVSPRLGECIKYWSAGLTESTGRVVLFLHGDFYQERPESHERLSGAKLSADAAVWSRRLRAPYIYLGRPGTHGSSGDHRRRRTSDESLIVSKALDALKQRHGITEFVVAGQSGGGHLTASLLTLRDDIVCAVPTSAPSSPRIRYLKLGRTRDVTNFDSYEPVQHLKANPVHERLRVFILGDPADSNVFWESQVVLAEPLKERGIEHAIVEGEAVGPERHGLNNSARTLAGLCFHDRSTDEIREHLRLRKIKG